MNAKNIKTNAIQVSNSVRSILEAVNLRPRIVDRDGAPRLTLLSDDRETKISMTKILATLPAIYSLYDSMANISPEYRGRVITLSVYSLLKGGLISDDEVDKLVALEYDEKDGIPGLTSIPELVDLFVKAVESNIIEAVPTANSNSTRLSRIMETVTKVLSSIVPLFRLFLKR